MKRNSFFSRHALLILIVIFFCVPFALRGARMSVQQMKNDVKDWLPKDFPETAEFDWFRRHFITDQFVVVSWDGCRGDAEDQRYQLFVAKLRPETAPSELAKQQAATAEVAANHLSEGGGVEEVADQPATERISATRHVHRPGFIGDELGLYLTPNQHENWGLRGEKWLRGWRYLGGKGNEEAWYYITPEGDLYRWNGVDMPIASLGREIQRQTAPKPVEGDLVYAFGPVDGPWYHAQPRRLRAQLFKTITTGPDVLASLAGEGGELADNPEAARERLRGMLFGKDDVHTCIALTLTDAAKRNLHLVLGRGVLGKPRGQLYEIAGESSITEDELRMGGPPVDNVAIDEEGSVTLFNLVGMCMVLGIGLSLIVFRSITATIMVFFIGGMSAVMSLAFIWWFGASADAITMSMPALVYVLGLSGAAHILNYYHEAVTEHGYHGAPERAIAHGWKPALLCNITTAIGLFSLYTSELSPIRKFGVFSGLGVLATLIVLFTYLPAALQIWPQKPRKKEETQAEGDNWLERLLSGFWARLGDFVIRRHAFVAPACLLIIIAVGYGVVYMKTSVNMLRMFHPQAKIIRDYEWLETHLGELVPMEIVVKTPRAAQLPPMAEQRRLDEVATDLETRLSETSRPAEQQQLRNELLALRREQFEQQFQLPFLERMELADRVRRTLEEEFGPEGRNKIGRAMSAATFVRPLPDPKGDSRTRLVRNATSNRLELHRDEFLNSDYLRIDQDDAAELWRVSVRVGATRGIDYGSLIHELKGAVEPILAAQAKRVEILRTIAARRQDQLRAERAAAGEPPPSEQELLDLNTSGARVLLVGLTPRSEAAAELARSLAGDDSAPSTPIEQSRIFSETLADLLSISRLRLTKVGLPELAAEKWQESLASYDCVALVGGSDVALQKGALNTALQAAGVALIDIRQHGFDGATEHLAASRTAAQPAAPMSYYTGVVPIVYKAQRALLDSLIESTFWSLLTITPLMMFISRSFWGGLVAMLPNVLPVLMVFGGMGWLKIEVDVGSMMCASIALGVAVDDTIHYLSWYREELDRLRDRKAAILSAYRHCATPTLQAAVLSGLGLSIFAFSTFTPTQRFGYLMLVILWLGVVAELIFFPAILAGPLGLVFRPRAKPEEETHPFDSGDSGEDSTVATIPLPSIVPIPAPHTAPSVRPTRKRGVRGDGAGRA
jgi:predicted RND superfamily exporter protein